MRSERPPPPGPVDEPYAHLHQALSRAVGALCPPWLSRDRDDIVQMAMIRVLKILRRSEGEHELPSSYLWRVAHSALVDEIRRFRRSKEEGLDKMERSGGPAWREPDPERVAQGREIGAAILDCLSRLVRNRRLAVTLSLQGHSVPEAAMLLGYGRKKTENLVYRGLADMRRCLSSRNIEP